MSPDAILDAIEEIFPDAHCELIHENGFQLAIAVVLSAQSTDEAVNRVTPALFERYPDPGSLAKASPEEAEEYIRTLGLYKNKARSITGLARVLHEEFDDVLPSTYEELQRLPGVGRKSANVIRSVIFDIPSLAVDTHVERVSKRLGLADVDASVKAVEDSLMEKLPRERWNRAHHDLIFFGRYFCRSRKPMCEECPFGEICQKEELDSWKEKKKSESKSKKSG